VTRSLAALAALVWLSLLGSTALFVHLLRADEKRRHRRR
jgi:hypothetical protein